MNQLIKILTKHTGEKFILPFYHAVGDYTPGHLKNLYQVRSTSLFERDVLFFKSLYQSVGSAQLGEKFEQPSFHISFDDGLRQFKENAWPILKKHKVAVTLFINPDFVDNKSLFYRFKASLLVEEIKQLATIDLAKIASVIKTKLTDKQSLINFLLAVSYQNKKVLDEVAQGLNYSFECYLLEQKPYLSLAELLTLQKEGVSIGAHSMDHPLFNQLSLDEQFMQIKESVQWVHKHLGEPQTLFSFPFTDYGVPKSLFECMNNELSMDFSFGTAGLKKELIFNHLQRIPMENNQWSAKRIVTFQYLYFLLKAFLGKNTIKR